MTIAVTAEHFYINRIKYDIIWAVNFQKNSFAIDFDSLLMDS